jgi:hypothetical protein
MCFINFHLKMKKIGNQYHPQCTSLGLNENLLRSSPSLSQLGYRSIISVLKIAIHKRVNKVVFCAYRSKNIELSKQTEQSTVKIRNKYAL